jgi:hypothetical protein
MTAGGGRAYHPHVPDSPAVVVIDPLLGPSGADAMLDLCERFGTYGTYAEHERIEVDIGPGLAQRHDSVMHFLRSGGIRGADESLLTLGARTSYFREEYAYGRDIRIAGIEPFLDHDGLRDAAQRIHGRDVVEPVIAYANLMLPGQELAVHTDVPEFRGVNRKLVPQWLLVVMHHSRLFADWRLHIATGIAWFGDPVGGSLLYWTDPGGPPTRHATRHDTALVLDTDSVFHGVDRVGDGGFDTMPPITAGCHLRAARNDTWMLSDPDGAVLASYDFAQLRFSVSWKAYCFAGEAERRSWREHLDDLHYDRIVARLVDDLRSRGREPERVPRSELGALMIDEYVRFPTRLSVGQDT